MLEMFFAELRRTWILSIRYPAEAIGQILITVIIFCILFLGLDYVASSDITANERFETIIVSYVVWTLVIFTMSGIARELQYEVQTGTLEQVFLSPFGAPLVFLSRAIANMTLNVILMSIILLLILLITGTNFLFSPILLIPLLAILTGATGLAFLIGSFSLLFKSFQQLFGLLQFIFLVFLNLPVETWNFPLNLLGWMLPMISSTGLLRKFMALESSLNGFELLGSLLNGVIYLIMGLLVFRVTERKVKKQGRLSAY